MKGSSSQACAACKYQRRRCNTNCILAPYFPADKPKMFQNAHRLFGVSNIVKILHKVRDDQRDEAMKSIIYEANMREKFPVHGCSFVTYRLEEQIHQYEQELYHVKSCLATFRDKDPIYGRFQLGHVVPSNETDIPSHSNVPRDIKPGFCRQPPNQTYTGDILSNDCSIGMKSHFRAPINFDVMAFDTIVDHRQRYVSKEVCESSASRDTISPSHELKIAAARFSLKSVNLGKTISG